MAIIGAAASALSLDGKQIKVVGGDQDSLWAPVSVAFSGPALKNNADIILEDDEGNKFTRSKPSDDYASPKIFVVDAKTDRKYGATLRDGQLVFVPEKVAAGSKLVFTVKVEENTGPHAVQTISKGDSKEVYVAINNQWFTSFFYDEADSKPYLWPVLSEGGMRVTRDWPLAPAGDGTTDHVHQRSIWSAYGDINGHDAWEEYSEDHALELVQKVESGSGGAYGWITLKGIWCDAKRKPFIDDHREYRFYDTPEKTRFFDAEIALTANYGDAQFGEIGRASCRERV